MHLRPMTKTHKTIEGAILQLFTPAELADLTPQRLTVSLSVFFSLLIVFIMF